jgi:anti-sigma factor RsiW
MKCKDLKDRLADYLLGGGDEAVNAEISAHLADCRGCSSEYESLSRLWDKLGLLGDAEPSKTMRARFYSMLDGYKDGIELSMQQQKGRSGLNEWLGRILPATAVLQFALAVLLLVAGAVIGRIFSIEGRSSSEMAQLREEVHNMRQMVTISLSNSSPPASVLRAWAGASGFVSPMKRC